MAMAIVLLAALVPIGIGRGMGPPMAASVGYIHIL